MKSCGHQRLAKTSSNSNSHKSSPKRKSLIGFFENQQSWARVSEGPRIRAGEEVGAGDIAPIKTGTGRGARGNTNREKFDPLKPNFWEILDHPGEPGGSFIATIRTDVPANFLSRNGGRAMAGYGQESK
jgi:hypothetical protein